MLKFQEAERIAETLPGPNQGVFTGALKDGPLSLGDMRNGALQGVLEPASIRRCAERWP
jgi:hypothetical protein